MKHLQTYNEINESWKQAKLWLKLPAYLIDFLFSKLLNYVPNINFKYDKLSANFDNDQSFDKFEIKEEPKKITIDDVESNMLKSKLKSFFNKWNVYYVGDSKDMSHPSNNLKQRIWITKDELHKGDFYYGERISDFDFKNDLYKDFPQLYIVVAKHTEEHVDMRKERDIRYNKQKYDKLTKDVDNMLKNNRILGYNRNGDLLFWNCIEDDRYDLIEKILNNASDKEKEKLLKEKNKNIHSEYLLNYYSIVFSKNIEMFNYLLDKGAYYDNNWRNLKNKQLKTHFVIKELENDPSLWSEIKDNIWLYDKKMIEDKLPYITDSDDLGLL